MLYGGSFPGLYNEGNVIQFGEPIKRIDTADHSTGELVLYPEEKTQIVTEPLLTTNIKPKAVLPVTVYQSKFIENQNIEYTQPNLNMQIPQYDDYYLNQYAESYSPNKGENKEEISIPSHQYVYSTLEQQPNYAVTKQNEPKYTEQNNQNNEPHGSQYSSIVLQPRGFSIDNNYHDSLRKLFFEHSVSDNTNVPTENVISYSTTPSPIKNDIESSTLYNVPYSTTSQPILDKNIESSTVYNIPYSTTPQPILHENIESTTNNNEQIIYISNVNPNVEVIPNGEKTIIQVPNTESLEYEKFQKNIAMNPILFNLMMYIKDNMPPTYKAKFESALKTYLQTPHYAQSSQQGYQIPREDNKNYLQNTFYNSEQLTQNNIPAVSEITEQNGNHEYRGDENNYDQNLQVKNIYYELDPAAYNSRQNQDTGTIFQVINENGNNLKTPNFYKPTDPNLYNQKSNFDVYSDDHNLHKVLRQRDNYPSGSTTTDFIWNAGDPTAPRDLETLVRQINITCAYFRFNETNDFTERDQDPHIWNAGDHTALRPEEELIKSINVTCDNFINDYLNNFTSGINLWQYCSQCLYGKNDQDVDIINKEIVLDENGRQAELFYNANQQNQYTGQYNSNLSTNQNSKVEPLVNQHTYEDGRSNDEIARIVKVYKQDGETVLSDSNKNNAFTSSEQINGPLRSLINMINAYAKQGNSEMF